MKNLDELAEGEVLRSMTIYQLLRPGKRVDSEGDIAPSNKQIEIRVFKYLNGERIGQFMAQPIWGRPIAQQILLGAETPSRKPCIPRWTISKVFRMRECFLTMKTTNRRGLIFA
jgi:hypothetical protein